jgi:prevent-host-death family protein
MKTISQRELRNESGEIMRGLARGESYRVTSRGVPVGMLGPIDASELDELTLRPGTGVMSFPTGVRVAERTDDALAELRVD